MKYRPLAMSRDIVIGNLFETTINLPLASIASDDLARTAWDNDNVDGESAGEKVVRIGFAKPSFRTIP